VKAFQPFLWRHSLLEPGNPSFLAGGQARQPTNPLSHSQGEGYTSDYAVPSSSFIPRMRTTFSTGDEEIPPPRHSLTLPMKTSAFNKR